MTSEEDVSALATRRIGEELFDERYFASNQRIESRNSSGNSHSHGGAALDYVDEDDNEDDDDEADEGDGEVEAKDTNCKNDVNTDKYTTDRIGGSKAANHFGSSVDLKDAGIAEPNYQHGRPGEEDDIASASNLHVMECSSGFSGRKRYKFPSKSGECLRKILSDPISGDFMDDAMILPCGHSFGSRGIQTVIKMKACYTCSHPVQEGSPTPNLSLRTAVLAFRREDKPVSPSKRRRQKLEVDNDNSDETYHEHPRRRSVQFPLVVNDRVMIKGNKRIPQWFVGREAVVTAQCLNGWYVVKTLDSAESVKVQYRSLAKLPHASSSNPLM